MALGNFRPSVREDRDIEARMKWHILRTKELVAEGIDKETASTKAYNEVRQGEHLDSSIWKDRNNKKK